MDRNFKSLSEALYADSDYLTKLANKPSMREYCQEIINATVDINRAAFKLAHPEEKTAAWVPTDEEPYEAYGGRFTKCNACGWLLYDVDTTDFFVFYAHSLTLVLVDNFQNCINHSRSTNKVNHVAIL